MLSLIKLLCFGLSLAILTASTIRLIVVVVDSAIVRLANLFFWVFCSFYGLMIGGTVGILTVGLKELITRRTTNDLPLVLGSIGGILGLGLGKDFAELLIKDINQSQAMSSLPAFGGIIFGLALGSTVGGVLGSVCGLTKPRNLFRRIR